MLTSAYTKVLLHVLQAEFLGLERAAQLISAVQAEFLGLERAT
ncbi:hypothetical protein [Paenibacillus sp. NPDC057967]